MCYACSVWMRRYNSTAPRITLTQLPSTVASTGPSAVLRAEAII